MNQSTAALSDSVTQILNDTYLKADSKPLVTDILRLNQQDMKRQYQNELSMMQNAKEQMNSGLYLSNIQKERSDQFDLVLAQRRYLWKEEEKLYKEVEDLRTTNKNYRDSVQKYGIKNQDLERTVDLKFKSVSQTLNNLQQQKIQVLENFGQVQQNTVPTKSKLSNTGQLVLQGNDQYRMMTDFINQQEKKIRVMKNEHNDPMNNQMIPFDKKMQDMAENTFEKQARYLYNGTKFEGNDKQKVQALSTLRNKIEQHIENRGMGGVVLDMPFKLDMTQQQESVQKTEYNQTIGEIEILRQEYIQSGGTDPNYLIGLNNMERHYVQNHPLNIEDHSKLKVNIKERNKITQNPIFNYLPTQFQQEIMELENEKELQEQSDQNNPLINKELMRPPLELGDSSKADENMLEYLRQQESELLQHNDTINRQKFNEIQRLKQIHEKRYLEKKVQEELASRQIEDDVMNQKTKTNDKQSYLQYIQGQINTMNLFYDPDYGFVIRFDYVTKLPICYDYIKLTFGIFMKENEIPNADQATNQHQLLPDGINSNQAILQERFIQRNHYVYPETYIYIVLWGFSEQFGGNMVPINIGWTLHKLFNEKTLESGCYLLPFYNSSFTHQISKLPEVQEIKLGMRISTPGDALLDINNSIVNQFDYNLQTIHKKDQELINQERQFNFKEHKIIDIPKDILNTQFNDPKLWQSQLPPNVYRLQNFEFLNNAQALHKRQLEEYEDRQQNRYKPRRRFLGKKETEATPAGRRKSSQKKTIIGGFRKRLQARAGKDTPASKSGSPSQSRIGSASVKNRSQRGDQKKTTSQPGKERYLTFKLRALSQIYVAGIQNGLKMKIALFMVAKLLEDDLKNQCLTVLELEPDEKGDNYLKYTVQYTFKIDLNDFFQDELPEDILQTYIFIAFFKDETTLFGWQALQVFEQSDEHFKVKSGIYYENLLGPPGQSPPFNLNRTKKLNVQLNCILMQDDDRILQLPQIDNYMLDQKLQTEENQEKRRKIYSVANPKWNSQIRLDLTKIKYFINKENFLMKLVVVQGEEVIIDAIERLCIKYDQIELYEGMGKAEFIANHTVILRIGSRYLTDIFPTNYKKLKYLFSFYNKQDLIGAGEFPLFSNNGSLNLGSHKLHVHDLDNHGQIGKKTNKEVQFYISEEALNLKEIEDTPKYAKQSKEEKQIAQQDKLKFLIIEINQLTDYLKQAPVDFTVQIYKNVELAADMDGNLCVNTNNNPYYPKPNNSVLIREQVYFKLPINYILEQNQALEEYQVFISFQNIGWISFPLFINGQLNSEEFVGKLFGGEVQAPPVDYRNLKKINTKIAYNVLYEQKPMSEANINSVQKSQESVQKINKSASNANIFQGVPVESIQSLGSRNLRSTAKIENQIKISLLNVTGFKKKINYFAKGLIYTGGKVLEDKGAKPCVFQSELVANNNELIFFKNVSFNFDVDFKKLQFDSVLFIQILEEDKTLVGWQYKELIKELGKIEEGKVFDKLYQPPLQKPPINKSQLKSGNQTIQFEVK